MYNEDNKNAFMEWYSAITSPTFLPRLFQKCEEYEQLYETDIGNFNLEQIIVFMKNERSSSLNNLRIITSILRTYTNWGKQIGIFTVNAYDEITTDKLMSCIDNVLLEKKYITPEVLVRYTDNLINACDKFIINAVNEGIQGDNYCEVLNICQEDLNSNDNTIKLCTGRIIKVSKSLMMYARIATNEFQYYSTKDNSFFISKLKQDNTLAFKPRDNAINDSLDAAYHRLFKRINKIKNDLNANELTLPRLYNSGIINAIIEGSSKLGVTRKNFIDTEEFKIIMEQYNIQKPLYQIRNMYKEYLEEN